MNILVTGYAGYVGPLVVKALKDHEVAGLDTGWFIPDHPEPVPLLDHEYSLDLRSPYLRSLPEYDAVVHLAGLSNDPMGDLHPNLTIRINYQGTIDLIRSQPNARHVVVSSCSVYGTNDMAKEDSPTNPLTAYARSKLMVDEWLAENRQFNAVSLRLGTVYGYSPGHRLDLVVNRMVHDAVTGLPVRVFGNAKRPLVHVEDVAEAIRKAISLDYQGVLNVVGENYEMLKLGEKVADFCESPLIVEPAGSDARDYMADGSLFSGLGWSPRHTVEGSLPVLAEKSINLPPGRYIRLQALNQLIEAGVLGPDLNRKEAIAA